MHCTSLLLVFPTQMPRYFELSALNFYLTLFSFVLKIFIYDIRDVTLFSSACSRFVKITSLKWTYLPFRWICWDPGPWTLAPSLHVSSRSQDLCFWWGQGSNDCSCICQGTPCLGRGTHSNSCADGQISQYQWTAWQWQWLLQQVPEHVSVTLWILNS